MSLLLKVASMLTMLSISHVGEASTVFDIAGSGTICNFTGIGESDVCSSNVSFTGTISIAINPAYATTSGYSVNSAGTSASDLNGWVASSFSFAWSGGSYAYASVPNAIYSDSLTEVINDPTQPLQSLTNRSVSQTGPSNAYFAENYAFLQRQTTNLTWLSGLNFPESDNLAPGANSLNLTGFQNLQEIYNSVTKQTEYFGSNANIYLSSMVAEPSPVPLPGSAWLMLSGLGFGAVTLRCRKA